MVQLVVALGFTASFILNDLVVFFSEFNSEYIGKFAASDEIILRCEPLA
jgi:hypothetical protein